MHSSELPPVCEELRDVEFIRGIIASANVVDHAEDYTDDEVLNAILRINHLETANSVSKETFRKALRVLVNMCVEKDDGD